MPNLKEYGPLLREALAEGPPKRDDAEMAIGAVLGALAALEEDGVGAVSGSISKKAEGEEVRRRLKEKVGELLADRVIKEGRQSLVDAVLDSSMPELR